MPERPVLFRGCTPAVAAGADGRILALGDAAAAAAGPDAEVVELEGEVGPGFADSHIHIGWCARQRLTLDLDGATGVDDVVARVRRHAAALPPDAWVVGHHLDDSSWPDGMQLRREHLDGAAGSRPVFIHRRDTHLAWVSSAALRIAGVDRESADPPGGVVDRDGDGEPAGVVRENAAELVRRLVPDVDAPRLRDAIAAVGLDLAALGVTSVHAIESAADLDLFRALRESGRLPFRVSAFLPVGDLDSLATGGVRAGDGDDGLRVWGVKVFLDGSLGSDTAEMLDGAGVAVLPQEELRGIVARAAGAGLNLAIHAIGDAAVRRCLDALAAQESPGAWWRPRIEHAQCVDPADLSRFARLRVIASMQPVHAVSDRDLAERRWGSRCAHAYAWGALHRAGAALAFGSDAPVDDPSPLAGIQAATRWRAEQGWHPQLRVAEAVARDAYTRGAAYAVGMEDRCGALAPGAWCDLAVVRDGAVVATVLGGAVTFTA